VAWGKDGKTLNGARTAVSIFPHQKIRVGDIFNNEWSNDDYHGRHVIFITYVATDR